MRFQHNTRRYNNQPFTDHIVDYYLNNDCNSLMQLGVLNGGKCKYNHSFLLNMGGRFALDDGGGDIMLRGVVQNIIRCNVVGHNRVYLLGPVYPL